jgi:hypothetical protein
MTVPTAPPAAVRSTGSQISTASRTPSSTGTYTDWRRRDVSTITPPILARVPSRGEHRYNAAHRTWIPLALAAFAHSAVTQAAEGSVIPLVSTFG